MEKSIENLMLEQLNELKENEREKRESDLLQQFIENLMSIIEEKININLMLRPDYIEKVEKVKALKDNYPKIRTLIEDKKTEYLSIEESKALLEIMNLYEDMKDLEIEETFKIGIYTSKLIKY